MSKYEKCVPKIMLPYCAIKADANRNIRKGNEDIYLSTAFSYEVRTYSVYINEILLILVFTLPTTLVKYCINRAIEDI